MAEPVLGLLDKFGLEAFGGQGDPFDPTLHEAVTHDTSSEVTEPTATTCCGGASAAVTLLRPAMVAVHRPKSPAVAAPEGGAGGPRRPAPPDTGRRPDKRREEVGAR